MLDQLILDGEEVADLGACEVGVAGSGVPTITDEADLRKNGVVEGRDGGTKSIRVGDQLLPLSQFLAYCGGSLSTEPWARTEGDSVDLHRARELFVRAGLDALAAQPTGGDWLQIGIRPPKDLALRRELCRQIAGTARRLLIDSAVDNFFHMNKPPGIRLRFQRSESGPDDLADALYAEVAGWHADGLVELIEPGVYEPESQVFGGPISMRYAHALFTVDSLIWLDYHACPIPDGEDGSAAWLVSLAMLRAVFDGLDITDREDRGVWDRIRGTAGRRLGRNATGLPEYASTASQIRAVWLRRDQLVEQLHPAIRSIVADHEEALRTAAAQWRSGYFSTRAAYLGPRAVAAFYVIFHWNRAALSAIQQALLAESLSQQEG
jgi:thiopeptide-type bacteriocin biosynthesis protein